MTATTLSGAATATERPARARWAILVGGPGSLVLYLLAALGLVWPMLAAPAWRILDGGTDDPAQTTWFFAEVAHALVHGHDPLVTTYLQYPDGINLMWNAAMPLLGILAAPITLTAGPVAAENVMIVLGVALTAWSTRFWLRRHAGAFPAFVGGLVVAFSPYAVGQLQHHLGQAVLVFVPLMLMLLEDLLWRRPRPQWLSGVLLGAATVGQALINAEVVLICVLGLLVALVTAAVARPRAFGRGVVGALPGFAAALGSFGVLYAYPLWDQFHNQRMTSLYTASYVAEPRDLILPVRYVWLHWSDRTQAMLQRGTGPWEIGSYVGLALLLVLIGTVIALRRRLGVQIAAVVFVVMTVLSFGVRLRHGTQFVGPSLPWRWVQKLPGMFGVLPARLSVVSWFAVAYLVAAGLDAVWGRDGRRSVRVRWAGVAVVLVSLVPLIPNPLPIGRAIDLPHGFAAAVRDVPAGSPIVTLPVAEPHSQRPMLWVAESGMRVRLIGGAAKRPGPGGVATSYARQTPLTVWAHAVTYAQPVSDVMVTAARDWMRDHGVRALVVAPHYAPGGAVAEADRMLGPPSRSHGDVQVWLVH